MKRVCLFFKIFVLIILIVGCAPKTTSIKVSNNTSSENPSYKYSKLSVSFNKNKTVVIIPIKKETVFSYTYKFPFLNIKFSLPVEYLELPAQYNTDVINNIKLLDPNSLSINLKTEVQFIILRDSPDRLKIILVPRGHSSPNKEDLVIKNKLKYIKFFKDEDNNFFILLKAEKDFTYKPLKAKKKHLKFLFPNLDIPAKYRKLYNLSKFKTVVKSALLEGTPKGGILTLYLLQRVPLDIEKGENSLRIEFSKFWLSLISESNKKEGLQKKQQKALQTKEDYLQAKRVASLLLPGMKDKYTGTPISIDLQDADVEHVLRLLSEIGKFNLILDGSVKGKVSLKLKNTPWDQVLDLVLIQKNLGMVRQGNIVRIAPITKLKEEQERIIAAREAILKAKRSKEKMAPLKIEYVQINYAKASDIRKRLKDFVSKRGKVSFDPRTNQIIIYDTEENINKIKSIIRKLDRAEKQVLIEARIVYAKDNFLRAMGIKWGGSVSSNATRHGNRIGYGVYGAQGELENLSSLSLQDVPKGFAIDLPMQEEYKAPFFGLGWYLAKLTGKDFFVINAEITLGESKGMVRTISSPRIVTLNNQKAEVVKGTQIATKTESESGGTTTEYVEAVLKLSVTPQITPDNKLILTLEISDDSPVPGGEDIETKKISTKLIVNDGETIVIGGVQKVTEDELYHKVPGLGDIPILGWLFKSKAKKQNKEELLIFIRPKIL